jgi:superoxide dismutase, Fe-Mn family
VEGTNLESATLDVIIHESAFDSKKVALFNNSAQHFNHSFFWKCIKPHANENFSEAKLLYEAIVKSWGSLDKFKAEFTEKSMNLFGSGWCWLVT